MLKKHWRFWESILLLSDIVVIVIAWIASYYIRFTVMGTPGNPHGEQLRKYLILLLPITLIWAFSFKTLGLYKPRRIFSHISEVSDILKASTLAIFILISTFFFTMQYDFSRLVILLFLLLSIIAVSLERFIFREFLRYFRRKGYNIRRVIIVGAGDLGERVVKKIKENPWTGLEVVGYFDDIKASCENVEGKEVLGKTPDIVDKIKENHVDQVFIALPIESHRKLRYLIERLKDEAVTIRIVPDIYQATTLNASVEEFEGIHLINVTDSRMYGWSLVFKRLFDLIFALFALIITLPVILIIIAAIKATSSGPVFYRQERMGLDGKTFKMLKFRSMKVDAESETGAVWAQENDSRKTLFGTFLRKTSLDELPQFLNVIKGEMSIIGPRPERPVFIEKFRKNIPGYMLRTKMKAGITGWAQVNGWRGNTSLEKRHEHDIYYIENWSVWLDIKIIWLTIWKGFIHKNAY